MRTMLCLFFVFLLAAPAGAENVTFLFDTSGSMMQNYPPTKSTKLEAAKMAARELLRCVPTTSTVGIRTFAPLRTLVKDGHYTTEYLQGVVMRIPDRGLIFGRMSATGDDVAFEARRHWGHPWDTLLVFTDSPANAGRRLGWTLREISEREPDLNIRIVSFATRPKDAEYLMNVSKSRYVDGYSLLNSAEACGFIRTNTFVPDQGPLLTVYFATGSSRLSRDAKAAIANAAPRLAVGRHVVAGYADVRGRNNPNVNLAARRANAVRRELIRCGVPAENLAVAGAGVATKEPDKALDRVAIVQRLN